jgi:hypothetical protein
MWHTGRIGSFGDPDCLGAGLDPDSCQGIETVGGDEGERTWFELLLTPEMEKVDPTADSVNILNFAWNQAIDLEDSNVAWTWEIDGDVTALRPVDLTSDGNIFGIGFGGYTPRGGTDGTSQNNPDLTNGFSMFAPVTGTGTVTQNGSLGLNRHGQNVCYLEGTLGSFPVLTLNEIGLAGPLDDDLNNGYCPGDLARTCTERCKGAVSPSVNGSNCSTVGGADAACTGDGGTCVNGDPDALYNDCDTTLVCDVGGSNECENVNGVSNGFACTTDADCYTCIFPNTTIDEYVTPNGPIRNMNVGAFNGPDLRFTTVEDIAGETKDTFQAAIGIVNFEKPDAAADDPATSYGIGVDDVVVEWQEITLVDDDTDCATAGSCANLDTSVGATFNSATFLDITLQDTTPSNNDCNDDGDNTDAGVDDKDCNNNGIPDVRVTGKSENEPTGERVTLDCKDLVVSATCADGEYFGSLPVSATYNSPGVVFVQAQGVDNPVVEINYFDYDDGLGQVCQNSLLPEALGLVQSFTTVVLTGGNVALIATAITDNGDGDVWADTNETVDMVITLRNQTGVQLNNVQARMATSDPKIDCIINPIINVGTIPPDDPLTLFADEGIITTTGAFTFRIAPTANRQGTCSVSLVPCGNDTQCTGGGGDSCDAELREFSATMNVFLSSDEFDTAFVDQKATIPLDLDATGGGTPTTITETFAGGFGIFSIDNIDSDTPGADPSGTGAVLTGPGIGGHGGSLANSDGYRCSFADPDYINAFTYGDADCYMGVDVANADATWWQIVTERAAVGSQSLAYTSLIDSQPYEDPPGLGYTTPTGVMEAAQTTLPYALGYKRVCTNSPTTVCEGVGDSACPTGAAGLCQPPKPRAVWKHQISLLDFRTVNASGPLRSADGGVVHVQLADPATNAAAGDWIKVETVANQYDSQREDNYNVCSFDPVDDGNNEDSFFDPTDPFRRYGPSSTCFPEFSYTYMGDTDSPFDPDNIGNATQGPGLEGSVGPGTWVESVVDFSRFRAQYVRIRMLVTSLKLDATWYEAFNYAESIAGDDGWFIDDFQIRDAITSAADLDADVKPNASVCSGDDVTPCASDDDCTAAGGFCRFPACGAVCSTVTPLVEADPAGALPAPSQVVELNAAASFADRCSGGVLQYRFWKDNDDGGVGSYEPGTDTLLRNWSENALLLQAPANSSDYAVDVRCSALTSCAATVHKSVTVNCPISPSGPPVSVGTVTADGSGGKSNFQWTAGTVAYAYGEGLLSTLDGSYTTATNGLGNAAGHTVTTGGSIWVLFRTDAAGSGLYCNSPGPGSWGSTARDANLP